MYVCIYIYISTHIGVCIYIYIYIYIYMYTKHEVCSDPIGADPVRPCPTVASQGLGFRLPPVIRPDHIIYIYIYVCMYVCMYVCVIRQITLNRPAVYSRQASYLSITLPQLAG